MLSFFVRLRLKISHMSKVELLIVEGANSNQCSLGFFELDTIPRVGEFVFHDLEATARPGIYKVKDVIHKVEPKMPIAILMVDIED
jgi:hypothetical protein